MSLSFPVCQATAEANNLTAVAGAKDMYSKNMELVRTCFSFTLGMNRYWFRRLSGLRGTAGCSHGLNSMFKEASSTLTE